MRASKFKNKVKSQLGIADAEFFVILILSIGLFLGIIYKNFFTEMQYNLINKDEMFNTLDSLAELNKTTFIGSNYEGEAIAELEQKDTIIKKEYKKKKTFQGKININTASKNQLKKLYRIGEKTAEKIIKYRTKTPFKKKEDIMKVRGIGPKTFDKIKNNIKI